jgi:prolyl-tRNA synthetase
VGHIFQLGTKYSEPMKAYFVDRDGKEKPIIMGCYGIGIGRTMAAAIEAHHDEQGIKWPYSIAPYQVIVMPVNASNEEQMQEAQRIYEELLNQGFEVLLDDRDVSAGVKFNEADLLGFPVQVIVGTKFLKTGKIEVKFRMTGDREELSAQEIVNLVHRAKSGLR